MAFQHPAPGGAFKAPAQGQDYAHNHAAEMAHAANRRLAVAKALSGGPPMSPQPAPSGPSAPPMGGPAAGPPGAANYKVGVAMAARQHGVHAAVHHVHNAIASLTHKGALTPTQGQALVQHNGPLVGPAGQRTMGMITNELVTNPAVRR